MAAEATNRTFSQLEEHTADTPNSHTKKHVPGNTFSPQLQKLLNPSA